VAGYSAFYIAAEPGRAFLVQPPARPAAHAVNAGAKGRSATDNPADDAVFGPGGDAIGGPADGTAAKTPAPATVSMLGEQGDINAVG